MVVSSIKLSASSSLSSNNSLSPIRARYITTQPPPPPPRMTPLIWLSRAKLIKLALSLSVQIKTIRIQLHSESSWWETRNGRSIKTLRNRFAQVCACLSVSHAHSLSQTVCVRAPFVVNCLREDFCRKRATEAKQKCTFHHLAVAHSRPCYRHGPAGNVEHTIRTLWARRTAL